MLWKESVAAAGFLCRDRKIDVILASNCEVSSYIFTFNLFFTVTFWVVRYTVRV